ncbi:MAG: hypothetical protein R2737_07850 [Candidatus Nanopelagicales bacterium]
MTTTKVLDFSIEGNHRTADRYGRLCFNVGLPDGREAYCLADSMTVSDGVLTLWSETQKVSDDARMDRDPLALLVLAPGAWVHAYAASALDGSPVGVSHLDPPQRPSGLFDEYDEDAA